MREEKKTALAGEYPPLPASYVGGTLLSAEPGITGCKVVLRFSNTDEAEVWFGALATRRAAPVAQGDALPREDFAWMVVQEACETEPADEDDPECIRILRIDLKSAVLAAFLRLDAARAQAKEGGA